MPQTPIAEGVVHTLPDDMKQALRANPAVLAAWNSLTPLSRNEWICWTISVKKPQTRQEHLERLCADLLAGKRRPCCWPGCPHRKPDARMKTK